MTPITAAQAAEAEAVREIRAVLAEQNKDFTLIIHGPQGCGMSRHAAALAKHYGRTIILDDWTPGTPVPADALVLTNESNVEGAIEFKDAMRAAGLTLALYPVCEEPPRATGSPLDDLIAEQRRTNELLTALLHAVKNHSALALTC